MRVQAPYITPIEKVTMVPRVRVTVNPDGSIDENDLPEETFERIDRRTKLRMEAEADREKRTVNKGGYM